MPVSLGRAQEPPCLTLAEVKALEWRLQLRPLDTCQHSPPIPRSNIPHWAPGRHAERPRRVVVAARVIPLVWSPSSAGPHPACFNPTTFIRAWQHRQKVTKLKNQRCREAFGSTNLVRSCGHSSSAESFWSWRLVVSSSSKANEHSEPLPPRGRRVTRTQRPLSTSSCNSSGTVPRLAASHKPPTGSTAGKHPSKCAPPSGFFYPHFPLLPPPPPPPPENCYKEASPKLGKIDAQLQALQEYTDSLDTHM
ncbi:centrosomal protein CCDC61-like [Aquila chrysaetos chrysaetos]|uniref:centrosomal protein CCDC61-like n=1 Tax=Aquila chrysaetos chrysaetos TaxID=223781 RepID=UPI001B7D3C41|nr:centrosomal protein CCDC61-like [Aquila chrysaetos chrysaetos]